MVLGILIFCIILTIITGIACIATDTGYVVSKGSISVSGAFGCVCLFSLVMTVVLLAFGVFHGFIDHPKTEGIHQGIITAVDLEGVNFRRYEIYLKTNGYVNGGDETVYKIYDYETELAQQLKDAIGKEVKLIYGHDGGYIGWNSCGTYHIKSVEILGE